MSGQVLHQRTGEFIFIRFFALAPRFIFPVASSLCGLHFSVCPRDARGRWMFSIDTIAPANFFFRRCTASLERLTHQTALLYRTTVRLHPPGILRNPCVLLRFCSVPLVRIQSRPGVLASPVQRPGRFAGTSIGRNNRLSGGLPPISGAKFVKCMFCVLSSERGPITEFAVPQFLLAGDQSWPLGT